ncbi:hypothetical protein [Clostridium cibarium]|uniref:Uncharacterized protein n=1 Tax=Clostridium cibarium TaxID=2762247 RepID=A0ABR8PPU5_9CLOT|nr:hypothetical protein [Clostridium cibarium]MBD7910205.1 hypothetical protein [Clostridium cibarium]
MNYEVMFYVGMALTIILLIITIVAFFKCNVVEIIYDLLGIKKGKKSNTTKKDKEFAARVQVKKVDEAKIQTKTDFVEKQVTKEYVIESSLEDNEGTQLLEEGKTGPIVNNNETSLLDDETSLLEEVDDETSLLEEETGLLDEGETSLLEEYEDGFARMFTKEIDITVIHTDMVI